MGATYDPAAERERRKRIAREDAARLHTRLCDIARAEIAPVLPLMQYAGCSAAVEGDDLVFTSPTTGRHALALVCAPEARVLAHWHGFAEQNGGDWALIRRRHRGDALGCTYCGESFPISDAYLIVTNFGWFCTGACAEAARVEMDEAAEESA